MTGAKLATLAVLVVLGGCGGEETAGAGTSSTTNASRGVTQGGPQDIARFRAIVDEGQVPAPETLDEVGFFAEHALDLPPADCGLDVCLHPMLAVAPKFDGGNWTMGLVALNSPVDPAAIERPPLHLVLAIERTERTRAAWRAVELGSRVLASQLRAEDRMSLVVFAEEATVVRAGLPPSGIDEALLLARDEAMGSGAALYDAIATSGRVAAGLPGFTGAARMLLVTSGHATRGITSEARVLGAAAAYAREGIALNVVGVGDEYRADIPEALGDLGIGSYSYAEDPADLDRILRFEGQTTLYPLARDFRMRVEAAPGYRIGAVYGARRAVASDDHATLASPALFLGHRTGSTDVGGGRRGGGGGFFVELVADPSADVRAGAPAFHVEASWLDADGAPVEVSSTVDNALAPGQNPDGMWPELSERSEEQAFMMLNMYLALRVMVDLFDDGDCARSMGAADLMRPAVELWQGRYDNPDIWDDFDLMLQLRGNVAAACQTTPIEPEFVSYSCFAS